MLAVTIMCNSDSLQLTRVLYRTVCTMKSSGLYVASRESVHRQDTLVLWTSTTVPVQWQVTLT